MPDEQEVITCFNRFRDALMACDTATLDELLADDYRGYSLRGEAEGREVILDAYRPGVTSLEQWEVSDLEVAVFPPVGIVTGTGYVAGNWKGIPWSHDLRFCDIFLKRDGDWCLYLSQATPIDSEAE